MSKNKKNENISVSGYLKKEYKGYAYYVIEGRALPSVIDGLKPTGRKIIFTANRHIKSVSNKVATLAGKVISDAQYHHGNVSCEGAIVNMTQEFKNNLPLFSRIGQFGSLKAPFASASRYISVKLSNNFDLVYKDTELLNYKIEEGVKIEPEFYLPIIPMVLVNGGSGIAVGYASNILNRDVKDITKKCINYLDGKRLQKVKPSIDGFRGSFVPSEDIASKWFINGEFKHVNTSTIKITELPPSMTYERIEDHLEELLTGMTKATKEKPSKPTKLGRVITNFDNNSKNGIIEYVVKFTRDDLSKYSDENLMKIFKLTDQVTENFTVLDSDGKLEIFNSAEDILKYFVDFRIVYYDKRKKFLLNKIKNDISKLSNKAKFIKGILDGKIIINKKSKAQIIPQIAKLKIDEFDSSYDYLLAMPIYSLTKEKYDELLSSIKDKKSEEKVIKKSVPKEVYLAELNELHKKL